MHPTLEIANIATGRTFFIIFNIARSSFRPDSFIIIVGQQMEWRALAM
jgi:hypothetical protein